MVAIALALLLVCAVTAVIILTAIVIAIVIDGSGIDISTTLVAVDMVAFDSIPVVCVFWGDGDVD